MARSPEAGPPPAPRLARVLRELTPFVNLGLFGLALLVVGRVLTEYPREGIGAALGRIPLPTIAAALAVVALGYLALVAQDVVAFRIVGRRITLRQALVPSFVSAAVSASAPGSMITGGGARYRLYRGSGVTAQEATAVAMVVAGTWLLGLLTLAGALLLGRPLPAYLAARFPGPTGRLAGALCLTLVLAYLGAAAARSGRAPRSRGLAWRIPPLRLALAQLGASLADWWCASATLYLIVASVEHVGFADLLAAFCIAQTGGVLLPVPGGLGVFEATILLLRPKDVGGPEVLAALLAYRVLYYLLPLAIAGVLAVRRELSGGEGRLDERVERAFARLAPRLLAGLTFLSGGLLFSSGAIARQEASVAWMSRILPPLVMDLSQFFASIVGTVLLVLAWGLERRSILAYRSVVFFFGWGILLALTRSMDLHIAVTLAVVLIVILVARRAYTEPGGQASASTGSLRPFAVGAVLLTSVWLGEVTRRWSEARGEPWWRFTLVGSAPASVRAAVASAVALLLIAMVGLMRRGQPHAPRTGWAEGISPRTAQDLRPPEERE